MTTISRTTTPAGIILWAGLGPSDDGEPLEVRNRSGILTAVQATGDFGTNGTITMQASLDGTNWFPMRPATRVNGTDDGDLVITEPTLIGRIMTGALYIRPVASVDIVDVDVHLSFGR